MIFFSSRQIFIGNLSTHLLAFYFSFLSTGNELRMRRIRDILPIGGAQMSEMARLLGEQNAKVIQPCHLHFFVSLTLLFHTNSFDLYILLVLVTGNDLLTNSNF